MVSIVLIASGIWGFIELAGEVMEGDSTAFDTRILLFFRDPANLADPIGPNWIEEFCRDLTALGGVAVLSIVTIAVTGYLYLTGRFRIMWLVLAAIGSGLVFSTLLKHGFDRLRPDLVPHGSMVYTASFPSGHSMLSAIAYLTLATLLAQLRFDRKLKTYLVGLAVLITGAVGISRVYLGVHWPSDVIGGWAIGASWAIMFSLIAQWWGVDRDERASAADH